jgi:hypothetical protein
MKRDWKAKRINQPNKLRPLAIGLTSNFAPVGSISIFGGAPGADRCGENGECHSFVNAGPFFSHPIAVEAGELHQDGDFVFADLLPAAIS